MLGSALAVGFMADEHGVDEKTIVLSDRDVPCEHGWTDDRTDTTVTMSSIPWVDGASKAYPPDSFDAAVLEGYDPTFDGVTDGGVRSFVLLTGTVTTLRAGTGAGTIGRVRFDLHATEGDDHAVGEVDVLQCE
jgi:hypothetical protein